MSADRIHFAKKGKLEKSEIKDKFWLNAIPEFESADNTDVVAVIKSILKQDNESVEPINVIKKIAIKTKILEVISLLIGCSLYLDTKTAWGIILWRRYWIENKEIMFNLKIFIPPEVEPLQAPIGIRKIKSKIGKAPHWSMLSIVRQVDVRTDTIVKILCLSKL